MRLCSILQLNMAEGLLQPRLFGVDPQRLPQGALEDGALVAVESDQGRIVEVTLVVGGLATCEACSVRAVMHPFMPEFRYSGGDLGGTRAMCEDDGRLIQPIGHASSSLL